MPVPQALLFDMDGLMLDSERLYQQAWQMAAAELGYQLDASLYLDLVGRSNAEAETVFRQVCGDGFPVESFRERWDIRWQSLIAAEGIPLKPGLLPLLDWVEQQGIPKAVGTSSSWREAETCLQAAQIRDRFTTLVTVDQVAAGKPAPDIFLAAAQRLDILPQHCLVLEDSNAGVKAAHSGGMPVIMVPDLQHPTAESRAIATAIQPSLHEVQAWLAALPWPSQSA